jgi:dihydroorotate dehydrogenase (NAD+) catalytic subunit
MLNTTFCGINFKNPLIAASGTFGYGLEFARIFDLSLLGGISVKGLSLKPVDGNPMPRIRETSSGLLNAIGLQNVGVHAFLRDKLPLLRSYDTKIIVNFWGKSIEDYAEVAEILDEADVDMLEMNISCPNVKEGGISFSSSPQAAAEVISAVRGRVKNKPLMVKLSPNVTSIAEYARAAESAGADALSAINTLMGMAINIHTRKPWLANVTGGLSGPAIKPVAIRMVYEISRAVKIPIMGMGGIANHEDVVEFFLAGASAVQVGTANLVEHSSIPRIAADLEGYCKANDVKMAELTGKLII